VRPRSVAMDEKGLVMVFLTILHPGQIDSRVD
jgi:hypothetical protein